MTQVYRAAFIADLVKLGIPPSTAADAVAELWSQWDGKQASDGRRFYGVLLPTEGNWSVLLGWRESSGGPLQKFKTSGTSGEIEFPKKAFVVLPISDVLDRVSKAVAGLLGVEGTKK
jgi:hypothetical protein